MQRPLGNVWHWDVTYKVESSGYVSRALVTASRCENLDVLIGTASCSVAVGDDLSEVLEFLAVESMLAACQPTLEGNPSHRYVDFVASEL